MRFLATKGKTQVDIPIQCRTMLDGVVKTPLLQGSQKVDHVYGVYIHIVYDKIRENGKYGKPTILPKLYEFVLLIISKYFILTKIII